MKKTLLTSALLFSVTCLILAQSTDSQHSTNTGSGGFHLDITSLIIGVVVGAAIGYFAGSKKS
jgi:F0F1-type ATP synthase assembly protein I